MGWGQQTHTGTGEAAAVAAVQPSKPLGRVLPCARSAENGAATSKVQGGAALQLPPRMACNVLPGLSRESASGSQPIARAHVAPPVACSRASAYSGCCSPAWSAHSRPSARHPGSPAGPELRVFKVRTAQRRKGVSEIGKPGHKYKVELNRGSKQCT